MMAQMGAEIIKVEMAPNGDYSRLLPFIRDGRSAYYVQQNRGKKSICVDLKHPAGLVIAKELIPMMDVVVENFAPGVIARLGLDYKTVSALNPKIVMCSVSTFGQTGPLSNRPGYDYIGASYAGVLDMIGYADRPPVFPLLGIGDVSTGVHAMGAITSALLFRERAGQGQYVETSLLDVYFHYHEANVQLISASRGAFKPRRSGAHHFLVCPCGIFKGKQNDLFIIALDQQWRSVCCAIGKPEMVEDPRFKDFDERVRNAAAIIEIIQEWLDSTKDDEEAMRVLGEHRVPFAPVLTVEQAMNHPHLRARRTVRTIKDRFLGEFNVPGFPLRFWPFRANCRSMRQPWASTTGKSCATIWDIRRSGSASSKRTASSAAPALIVPHSIATFGALRADATQSASRLRRLP